MNRKLLQRLPRTTLRGGSVFPALILLAAALAGGWLYRGELAFELGYALAEGEFHGIPITRDEVISAQWIRRAAQTGHPRAQYWLGLLHSRGRGVIQDDAEANRWFESSAAQGYPQACYHLAWMLHKGDGIARDAARAQTLMRRAADSGMRSAASALERFRGQGEQPRSP